MSLSHNNECCVRCDFNQEAISEQKKLRKWKLIISTIIAIILISFALATSTFDFVSLNMIMTIVATAIIALIFDVLITYGFRTAIIPLVLSMNISFVFTISLTGIAFGTSPLLILPIISFFNIFYLVGFNQLLNKKSLEIKDLKKTKLLVSNYFISRS